MLIMMMSFGHIPLGLNTNISLEDKKSSEMFPSSTLWPWESGSDLMKSSIS